MSELAGDPEMHEILRIYVGTLETRAEELRASAATGDWPRVRFLLHQLKGTAGSYGFPWITEAARELERESIAGHASPEQVEALARMCQRARSSLRPERPERSA